MRDRQQSSFYGLGILVGMRDGKLTVISPLEGTPGRRAWASAPATSSAPIEGEPTETMTLDDAVSKLKGPKDTEVTITIARRGARGAAGDRPSPAPRSRRPRCATRT